MSCLDETLAKIDGGHILDVGCGTGRFTLQLAAGLGSVTSIIGVDPDKDSIDDARRETDDRRITYRIASGEALKFSDERFDTVAMSHALHHLEYPDRVLVELSRVLKTAGLLILEEPVSETLTAAQENGRDIHHLKAAIDRIKGRCHRPTYTADEVRELVSQLGLELIADCIDAEVAEADPDAASEESNRDAIDFIFDYIEHIKETAHYATLLAEAKALSARIAASGIESVPRIVIVHRKPAGLGSPLRRA